MEAQVGHETVWAPAPSLRIVPSHDDKGQRPARQSSEERVVAFSCLAWTYRRTHIFLSARVSPRAGLLPPQRRALWRLPARGAAARALQDSRSLAPHPAAHGGGARYEKTCRAGQRTYRVGEVVTKKSGQQSVAVVLSARAPRGAVPPRDLRIPSLLPPAVRRLRQLHHTLPRRSGEIRRGSVCGGGNGAGNGRAGVGIPTCRAPRCPLSPAATNQR